MRGVLLILLLCGGCAARKPAALPQYTGTVTQSEAVSGSLGKARAGGESVKTYLRDSLSLVDQLDQKAAALLGEEAP